MNRRSACRLPNPLGPLSRLKQSEQRPQNGPSCPAGSAGSRPVQLCLEEGLFHRSAKKKKKAARVDSGMTGMRGASQCVICKTHQIEVRAVDGYT